jgi:hypothetical protein
MLNAVFYLRVTVLLLAVSAPFVRAQTPDERSTAVVRTKLLVREIAGESFPELNPEKIGIRTFRSDNNYFKSGFSLTRFLTLRKMRYLIYVNPKVFELNAPEKGIRAIIAHELAHVLYYTGKNRCQLLGLARLASGDWTAKFERRTDLAAIERGYGEGLIEYREWLYRNIPAGKLAAKKRDYFSPEEIVRILRVTENEPEMFERWRKDVPENIGEIEGK